MSSTLDFSVPSPGLFGRHTFSCALPTRGGICNCRPGHDPSIDPWPRNGSAERFVPLPEAQQPIMAVDVDPPSRTSGSGPIDVTEVSTIDKAIAILIERGEHPATAHATLAAHARRRGMEIYIYAAYLTRG